MRIRTSDFSCPPPAQTLACPGEAPSWALTSFVSPQLKCNGDFVAPPLVERPIAEPLGVQGPTPWSRRALWPPGAAPSGVLVWILPLKQQGSGQHRLGLGCASLNKVCV